MRMAEQDATMGIHRRGQCAGVSAPKPGMSNSSPTVHGCPSGGVRQPPSPTRLCSRLLGLDSCCSRGKIGRYPNVQRDSERRPEGRQKIGGCGMNLPAHRLNNGAQFFRKCTVSWLNELIEASKRVLGRSTMIMLLRTSQPSSFFLQM